MSEFDGTQIGPDGKRYNVGSVPSLTRDDVVGQEYHVYGTPGDGKSVQWNNTKQRAEWTSGGGGGGSAVEYGAGFAVIAAYDGPITVPVVESTQIPFAEDIDDSGTLAPFSSIAYGSWDDTIKRLVVSETGVYIVEFYCSCPQTPGGMSAVAVQWGCSSNGGTGPSVADPITEAVGSLPSGDPSTGAIDGTTQFTAILEAGAELFIYFAGSGGDLTLTIDWADICIKRIG